MGLDASASAAIATDEGAADDHGRNRQGRRFGNRARCGGRPAKRHGKSYVATRSVSVVGGIVPERIEHHEAAGHGVFIVRCVGSETLRPSEGNGPYGTVDEERISGVPSELEVRDVRTISSGKSHDEWCIRRDGRGDSDRVGRISGAVRDRGIGSFVVGSVD
jgi:hypothetical protein